MRYRAVGAIDQPELTTDPDRLYWMLDGISETMGSRVLVQALDEPERYIRLTVTDDHLFDLEWHDSTASGSLRRADILVVHQVLRCLSDAGEWAPLCRKVLNDYGSPRPDSDAEVNYAPTGLSISNAMGDMMGRKRRCGAPIDTPPRLRWGKLSVATGDVWGEVYGDVDIAVRVDGHRPELRHGISLSTPTPTLFPLGETPRHEVLLWPSSGERDFEVRGTSLTGVLRITTVYVVGGGDRSTVERWTGNAGFWVERESSRQRVYHANHHSTSPPSFEDLTFSVRLGA